MKPLSIEDVCPQPGQFTLSRTGVSYSLRPMSISDQQWMVKTFGDGLQAVFEKIKVDEICRIVFHQMAPESQKEFRAQDVKFLDDTNGEERTARVGGADLFKHFVTGPQEVFDIYKALIQTIGISQVIVDDLVKEVTEAEDKKKASQLTGEASLTSSPASTDTALTQSAG